MCGAHLTSCFRVRTRTANTSRRRRRPPFGGSERETTHEVHHRHTQHTTSNNRRKRVWCVVWCTSQPTSNNQPTVIRKHERCELARERAILRGRAKNIMRCAQTNTREKKNSRTHSNHITLRGLGGRRGVVVFVFVCLESVVGCCVDGVVDVSRCWDKRV